MRLPSSTHKKARIEIIPMIDVIFFLLVFFMISTLSMAVYRGMPVNLPKAASGREATPDPAMITVTKDGRIAFNREEVSLDRLAGFLYTAVQANPGLGVVISADEEALYGWVVGVLDQVRRAGVTRMAIAIRPKQ